MRDRLLVRHFLRRFLEHDLISPNVDSREAVSFVGGTLVAVSLFVSVLIAWQYQLAAELPPGMASLFSVADRFLFISASMLVMALLAVAQWDALTLDARDAAVLGVLPIRRAVIIRAKFVAVAFLALGTDISWNLPSTLFRFASVPTRLMIGVRGALILTLAHALVTMAAGVFGFLAIFGLREALTAVLGQDRFRSISAALQAVLVVTLTSALLLLPGSSSNVVRTWLEPPRFATKAFPPLWFVGLHETLAGSVIDSLPRVRTAPYFVVQERNATELYRRLWPMYGELGQTAAVALAVVTIITFAACAWNSRRLPTPAIRRPRHTLTSSLAWRWTVAHIVAPSSLRQAAFWFTLQTLPRRASHRAVLASSLAVGLSLIVITVSGHAMEVQTDIASAPLTVLAAQSLLIASVVTGFRRAAQLPAELRASSTFSLAWSGDTQPYLSGVKRAGMVALVLPILAIMLLWHVALLGVRLAVLHFGLGLAFSMILIEALFLRYRRVPFVSGYIPSSELKSRGVAYLVGILLVSFALARVERFALASPAATSRYVLLVAGLIGLSVSAAVFDRAWRRSPIALDLDEVPALPTQRLDLAG